MSDEIVLRLPDEPAFHNVAHLVVGGLAVRLNLTFENLEDVQLALEGLLGIVEGEVTVAVGLDEESGLRITVGPFECARLRRELEDAGQEVGLRSILEAVAEGVEVVERDGGCFVSVSKQVDRVAASR